MIKSYAGVPIKTAVSQSVLEAAYSGQFTALPLLFGHKQSDEVHLRSMPCCHHANQNDICTSHQASLVSKIQGMSC